MTDERPLPRRALLVLGHAVPQDEALCRAVALLARVSDQLHARFVEDEDLLRAAALPIAAHLFRVRAAAAPLHSAAVLDEWHAWSTRARQTILREAQRHNLRVEFEISRASRLSSVPPAESFDLTVFAQTRGAERDVVGSRTEPIKVLYDASPAAERALHLAVSLTNASHALQVWLLAVRAEARSELAQRLGAILGGRVSFRELPELSVSRDSVLRMLLAAGGGTFLLPASSPVAELASALSRDVRLPTAVVLTR